VIHNCTNKGFWRRSEKKSDQGNLRENVNGKYKIDERFADTALQMMMLALETSNPFYVLLEDFVYLVHSEYVVALGLTSLERDER
jgi:hypothetical protein